MTWDVQFSWSHTSRHLQIQRGQEMADIYVYKRHRLGIQVLQASGTACIQGIACSACAIGSWEVSDFRPSPGKRRRFAYVMLVISLLRRRGVSRVLSLVRFVALKGGRRGFRTCGGRTIEDHAQLEEDGLEIGWKAFQGHTSWLRRNMRRTSAKPDPETRRLVRWLLDVEALARRSRQGHRHDFKCL